MDEINRTMLEVCKPLYQAFTPALLGTKGLCPKRQVLLTFYDGHRASINVTLILSIVILYLMN